jgi:hypothetical protein
LQGLKHIPHPPDVSNQKLDDAFAKFKNNTLWKYYHLNDPGNDPENDDNSTDRYIPIRRTSYTTCNRISPNHEIHTIINEAEAKLTNYKLDNPPKRNRPKESRLLRKLKIDHPTVIFKPADKNLGLVAMDLPQYDSLVIQHLAVETNYTKVRTGIPQMQSLIDLLSQKYTAFTKNCYLYKNEKKFLKSYHADHPEFTLPKFYVLPKLHKSGPLKGRPIVGATNWITTPISKLLDIRLRRTITTFPSILKNSQQLVQELEIGNKGDSTYFNQNLRFIVGDVASLYPNVKIPKLEKIIADLDFECSDFTKFVLRHSYTEYNNSAYQQKSGIAMGTNSAVSLANIYMGHLIDPLLENHPNVLFYRRFIDDLFILWNGTDAQWLTLKCEINNVDDQILIDFSNESTSDLSTNVVFLDLNIGICPITNRFRTSIYQKPLNKYFYITPTSHHVPHTFSGFIKGELTRYARLSTSPISYHHTKLLFYQRLVKRGYSRLFLNTIFTKHNWLSRNNEQISDERTILPFVIPFSQRRNIKQLENYFGSIRFKFDPYLTHSKVMFVYSRTANLANILTESALTTAQTDYLYAQMPAEEALPPPPPPIREDPGPSTKSKPTTKRKAKSQSSSQKQSKISRFFDKSR